MDSGTGNHVASSAELAHAIEQTRASLGEKISALNHEVKDAFSSASERMKGSLQQARDFASPSLQFHRHPWSFCAAAFVVGLALQRRLNSPQRGQESPHGHSAPGAIRRVALEAGALLVSEAMSAWRKNAAASEAPVAQRRSTVLGSQL